MHFNLVLCLSVCGLCSAFFLFKDKKKPLIFCLKICPLYCPKPSSKRHDHDASSLIYVDNNPYITADASHEYGHYSPYQWKSNPTAKSTLAPTTSKKPMHPGHSPYFIEEGSGEYVYHPPSGYDEDWKPKPTQNPTEPPLTTAESPQHDVHPYIIEDGPYYYDHPHYYKHREPKPTKATTTKPTTTTEKPYLDHPYFIEDWPEYEYHAPRYYEAPHPTSSTTAKPTTTEEPTFICGLCAEKCDHKS